MKAKIYKTMMYKIIFGFFFLGLIVSCEDFLEEDPPSQISLVNIDNDNLESMIIGVYEPMTRSRGRIWETQYLFYQTLQEESSRAIGSRGKIAEYDFINGGQEYNQGWPTLYNAIGRANILLENLKTNDVITESTKAEAIGEASFVRAIVYYALVRGWGSVPMRLLPVTNSDETGQPLESIDNIYAQIITDLKIAESNLAPTTSKPGRATSGAAKVALADVYLTRGNFEAARDLAKEVMDNAGTYGYQLVDDYPEIFSPTAPTNSEDVFSLKFSQFVNRGNFINTYFAPANPGSLAHDAGLAARGLGNLGAKASTPLIANWDNKDLRKSWTLIDSVVIDNVKIRIPSFVPDTDYYYAKYRDPGAVEETAAGNDYYLYRYADVLLIFAEADNQVNGGPSAADYDAVNQIRRRGYGVDQNTPNLEIDLPAGLDQNSFDDMVFRERGYEFMAEGKRWFDMVRTGRWETTIPAAGKPIPNTFFWLIPAAEIANNPGIPK